MRLKRYQHSDSGHVKVVNDEATDYDWNGGGGFIRNSLIDIEKWRTGLNDSSGFKVRYYGVGKLNKF